MVLTLASVIGTLRAATSHRFTEIKYTWGLDEATLADESNN